MIDLCNVVIVQRSIKRLLCTMVMFLCTTVMFLSNVTTFLCNVVIVQRSIKRLLCNVTMFLCAVAMFLSNMTTFLCTGATSACGITIVLDAIKSVLEQHQRQILLILAR